ncbi:hypothetical protein ACTXT7_005339 [Hymenolepis weldensis]
MNRGLNFHIIPDCDPFDKTRTNKDFAAESKNFHSFAELSISGFHNLVQNNELKNLKQFPCKARKLVIGEKEGAIWMQIPNKKSTPRSLEHSPQI